MAMPFMTELLVQRKVEATKNSAYEETYTKRLFIQIVHTKRLYRIYGSLTVSHN